MTEGPRFIDVTVPGGPGGLNDAENLQPGDRLGEEGCVRTLSWHPGRPADVTALVGPCYVAEETIELVSASFDRIKVDAVTATFKRTEWGPLTERSLTAGETLRVGRGIPLPPWPGHGNEPVIDFTAGQPSMKHGRFR